MAAALATFGEARVRRAQIRQVRTELAPPEWKRRGHRKEKKRRWRNEQRKFLHVIFATRCDPGQICGKTARLPGSAPTEP